MSGAVVEETKPSVPPFGGSRTHLPKTTKMTHTGECGHTYSNRERLPLYLGRHPRTEENLREAVEWARATSTYRSSQPCLECLATASLATTRQSLGEILSALGTPAPPEISGSGRAVAFASSVRLEVVRDMVSHWCAMLEPNRYSGEPALVEVLVVQALRQSWGWDEREEPTAAMRDLVRRFHDAPILSNALRGRSLKPANVSRALAVWLLAQHEWGKVLNACGETRAKMWIAFRRDALTFRRSETPRLSALLAARVVASMNCWGTPQDARLAFNALLEGSESGVLPLFSGSSDSLPDLLEQAAVMSSLRPAPQSPWTAFGHS